MKLDYVSPRGNVFSFVNNPLFHLTRVDGITTATASLSSTTIGGDDGETVNSVRALPRIITIDLQPRGNVNVENAKREILKIVKLKEKGQLEWEYNNRTTRITGIVQRVEMLRWDAVTVMQIELYCEQPFWEDAESVVEEISEAISLHYFTEMSTDMLYFTDDGIVLGEYDTTRSKTFYNDGDVRVGLEIDITAFSEVTNPIIYDESGNFFGVGYGTGNKKVVMQSGDKLIITTHRGDKRVTLNGEAIFDKIKPRSTWLQLETGENRYAINSDDEALDNMTFSLIYKQRYI